MNRGYQNLKALENATVDAINRLETMVITEGNTASHQLGDAKSGLIRHINELAAEQRTYVDRADTQVRRDAAALLDTFTKRGFWSRLNWLLTGR